MTQPSRPAPTLRFQKKKRTRSALVDAAVTLCLENGYESTTIDDIAAAANISPRTFARYFMSKDAVFVAVLDDLAAEVATELWAVPEDVGPLQAMRRALAVVLSRAAGLQSGDRFVRTISVVTERDALRRAAIDYRGPAVLAAMAHRMGVDLDDRRLELPMTLISVTVVHAWTTLGVVDGPLDVQLISDQIERTFDEFASLIGDLGTAE